MKRFICVTNQFIGFHKYPDAPDEVAYLKNLHRHIFHTKIYIEIFGDNRELEFHIFKNYIQKLIGVKQLDNKSCEMISDYLYKEISRNYPNREIKIEVWEDLECGSVTEYEKGEILP